MRDAVLKKELTLSRRFASPRKGSIGEAKKVLSAEGRKGEGVRGSNIKPEEKRSRRGFGGGSPKVVFFFLFFFSLGGRGGGGFMGGFALGGGGVTGEVVGGGRKDAIL